MANDQMAIQGNKYGKSWREEAAERLDRMSGLYPMDVNVPINREPKTWWRNHSVKSDNE